MASHDGVLGRPGRDLMIKLSLNPSPVDDSDAAIWRQFIVVNDERRRMKEESICRYKTIVENMGFGMAPRAVWAGQDRGGTTGKKVFAVQE